jgi:hypothetical protein
MAACPTRGGGGGTNDALRLAMKTQPGALSVCRVVAFLPVLLAAFAVAGCAPEKVSARVDLVDRVSSALTIDTIMAVKGTYGAACSQRTGTWAIALNGYKFVTGETQLTVVTNDVGCVLSVTGVKAGALATPQTFQPATPIVLSASFPAQGVPFLLSGAGAAQFYANFRVQPDLTFATDFAVQMVYSDNVKETDLSITAGFVVVTGSATAALVPAPNGTLSLAALDIRIDAKNIIKSVAGGVTLTQGLVVGESYVVDFDTMGSDPTYAAIDAVFNSVGKTRVALAGASQLIPVAELNMLALDLSTPKRRNVIVANIDSGVKSYELFQITVNKP